VGAAWSVRMGLLAIFVLAMGACGGGAKPLPEESGSLPPGRYFTEKFEPALSFEVGQGWAVATPEEPGLFGVVWRAPQAGLDPNIYFIDPPSEVYSSRNPDEIAPVPAPENWVAWFRGHPYLQVDEPQPISVGGVEGQQIDMSVDLLPEEDYYHSVWCGGGSWVALWPLPYGAWCVAEGTVDRIVILEDVGGKTVLIDIGATAGTVEEFIPRAQKVLDTVEWEDA
jgi:hypothetical protein